MVHIHSSNINSRCWPSIRLPKLSKYEKFDPTVSDPDTARYIFFYSPVPLGNRISIPADCDMLVQWMSDLSPLIDSDWQVIEDDKPTLAFEFRLPDTGSTRWYFDIASSRGIVQWAWKLFEWLLHIILEGSCISWVESASERFSRKTGMNDCITWKIDDDDRTPHAHANILQLTFPFAYIHSPWHGFIERIF